MPLDTTSLNPSLARLLEGIAEAASAPPATRAEAVARAIAVEAATPGLLDGFACPCRQDRYVRHLLAENTALGYAVVALVWRPGQMSPVHAHQTWCALGVHRGALTETFYTPAEPLPEPRLSVLRRPGDISHGEARPDVIHRIANLGTCDAVSIHCYGVAYERMGSDVNVIFAE
ncbi:Cysteine dioxygenase type I [Humitalea rosea]|uniref:Cysteine dioxygenase type I n=1 Tax=Humitalea rosea TaxID=990373 RepID=A0A2W7IPI0_9PROT|nr:cysteine dioxygenase family protein [Humitalea rosea]PZW49152.1 Cysteine dioxygenase type I [Humitalea rosea]